MLCFLRCCSAQRCCKELCQEWWICTNISGITYSSPSFWIRWSSLVENKPWQAHKTPCYLQRQYRLSFPKPSWVSWDQVWPGCLYSIGYQLHVGLVCSLVTANICVIEKDLEKELLPLYWIWLQQCLPETPKVVCAIKHFTLLSIGMVVSRWVDFNSLGWTIPFSKSSVKCAWSSADLCHQQNVHVHRTAALWMFSVFLIEIARAWGDSFRNSHSSLSFNSISVLWYSDCQQPWWYSQPRFMTCDF